MSLTNWLTSPLDLVTPFQRSVDRFFFDTLADIDSRITKTLDRASDVYTPNIDISEDADNFYLIAELPGLSEDNVKVTVDNDTLTIQGRKERKEEQRERNYHRIERSFGEFIRSMSIPTNVKGEKIVGTFKDGLLELTLPKSQREAQSVREIPLAAATKDERSSVDERSSSPKLNGIKSAEKKGSVNGAPVTA